MDPMSSGGGDSRIKDLGVKRSTRCLPLGILDPSMVDCIEILDQRLLDGCDFDQGQFAVIELTVEQFLHSDLID
jgi:hypothetical protein